MVRSLVNIGTKIFLLFSSLISLIISVVSLIKLNLGFAPVLLIFGVGIGAFINLVIFILCTLWIFGRFGKALDLCVYKGFFVWGMSGYIILVLFLTFVNVGWSSWGAADSCTKQSPHTCYCEAFKLADVNAGAKGVRQPTNTWFNLYSIITSFIIALWVYFDRKKLKLTLGNNSIKKHSKKYNYGGAPNLMASATWIPDIYIFLVLFLGLGSMWFHASLTYWSGILDGASMYAYVAFLAFYSAHRVYQLAKSALFLWIGYFSTVVILTFLPWVLKELNNGKAVENLPVILIGVLVLAYLVFEWVVIPILSGKFLQSRVKTILLWIFAALAMILATVFWVLSQTGGPLCFSNSFFQPHGLLWHPLAGLMATLLYFYWRLAKDPVGKK